MLKHVFIITLISLFSLPLIAQTDVDALNYSRWTGSATARSLGVGGAFGALGGDLSAININPGGIGIFRKSEISLTPAYHLNTVKSDFSGNTTDTNKNKFRFAGVGAAFVTPGMSNNWQSNTFAVTYNQVTNFDKKFSYENTTNGSIVESFVETATGLFPDQLNDFYEGTAYDVDLIYNPEDDYPDLYAGDLDQTSSTLKSETFESTGSLYDLSIAYGANYRHKFYIGGSIGLPFLNYSQKTVYSESDPNNQYEFFNDMTYTEEYATTGIGVNFKLGAIYKINRQYRVGLAVHTPTNFSLTDTEYRTEMNYNITYDVNEGPVTNELEVTSDVVEYFLKTPWRFVVSGAAVVKNLGLITADVEWVDYGRNKFSFDTDIYSFYEGYAEIVNGDIKDKYGHALNVRLGAEYAYNKLRARLGYAYYGTPFQGSVNTTSGVRQNLSFGLGVRPDGVYLDLAFVRNLQKELYVPYRTTNSPNVQEIDNSIGNNTIVLTAGFKF